MDIKRINNQSSVLAKVIGLGDKNSDALGFLPEIAFHEAAKSGRILVAIDDNQILLGYLLFNHSIRSNLTSITHLCIDESLRGRGIGRTLVNELKRISKADSYGIRVHCRRDWKAHDFWPRVGFIAIGEKPGRSQSGSTLTIFWYDHGYPNLFSNNFNEALVEKIHVAIDANILYDLHDKKVRNKDDSRALLSDWLSDEIELCVTQEIYNEIDRCDDPDIRENTRIFANSFTNIPYQIELSVEKQCLVNELFSDAETRQDESDKRQIEQTYASGIEYFITHDQKLLDKSNDFRLKIGVNIWSPAEFIIHIDSIRRKEEYHPSRLAGLTISFSRIRSEEINNLVSVFQWPTNEKKREFSLKLEKYAANPQFYEFMIIKNNQQTLGFIIYGIRNKNYLEVPILRLAKGSLSSPLLEYLITNTIKKASSDNYPLIKISETYLEKKHVQLMQQHGFFKDTKYYWRLSKQGMYHYEELSNIVNSLAPEVPPAKKYLSTIVESINTTKTIQDHTISLALEKSLWPLKFYDPPVNCFIVPIRPIWAINLFDSKLGSQELFGGTPTLVLITENVYYRSARQKILKAPGRILWYVSNSNKKNSYTNIQSIRACSYINEVLIDKPKILFREFKQMGTYEWDHVYETAENDINKDIMAFRFSHTEIFTTPISLNTLRNIWGEDGGKKFHPLAPMKISNELFLRLYSIGSTINYETQIK